MTKQDNLMQEQNEKEAAQSHSKPVIQHVLQKVISTGRQETNQVHLSKPENTANTSKCKCLL